MKLQQLLDNYAKWKHVFELWNSTLFLLKNVCPSHFLQNKLLWSNWLALNHYANVLRENSLVGYKLLVPPYTFFELLAGMKIIVDFATMLIKRTQSFSTFPLFGTLFWHFLLSTVPCRKTRLFTDTIWKTFCSFGHSQGTKMFHTSFESPKSDL